MSAAIESARAAVRTAMQQREVARSAVRRVEWMRSALQEQQQQAAALREQLGVEQADVEHWRGKGFGQMLWWLIGRLDERRDREQQETHDLALRLADQETLALQTEQSLAAAVSGQPMGSDADVDAALARLRATLQADAPGAYTALIGLERDLATQEGQVKETREAIAAVDHASTAVDSALDELQSAASWGTWDVIGGGWLASSIKHGHVDTAIERLQAVNSAMVAVQHELGQVATAVDLPTGLEAGSGARTLDVWFDNLFSDIRMQGRITELRDHTEDLRNRLGTAGAQLRAHLDATTARIADLHQRVDALTLG